MEAWHFTQIASALTYQQFVIDMINDNSAPSKTILDFGCGIGLIPMRLNKFKKYLGIDRSYSAISCARKINKPHRAITFAVGDATNIEDLTDDSYEVVLAINFLHLFSPMDVESFLSNVAANCPGASIIFDYNITWDKPAHEIAFYERLQKNLGILQSYENSEFGRRLFRLELQS